MGPLPYLENVTRIPSSVEYPLICLHDPAGHVELARQRRRAWTHKGFGYHVFRWADQQERSFLIHQGLNRLALRPLIPTPHMHQLVRQHAPLLDWWPPRIDHDEALMAEIRARQYERHERHVHTLARQLIDEILFRHAIDTTSRHRQVSDAEGPPGPVSGVSTGP